MKVRLADFPGGTTKDAIKSGDLVIVDGAGDAGICLIGSLHEELYALALGERGLGADVQFTHRSLSSLDGPFRLISSPVTLRPIITEPWPPTPLRHDDWRGGEMLISATRGAHLSAAVEKAGEPSICHLP